MNFPSCHWSFYSAQQGNSLSALYTGRLSRMFTLAVCSSFKEERQNRTRTLSMSMSDRREEGSVRLGQGAIGKNNDRVRYKWCQQNFWDYWPPHSLPAFWTNLQGITKETFPDWVRLFTFFCAHQTNLRQSRKHNHQIFTKPGKVSLVIPCIHSTKIMQPPLLCQNLTNSSPLSSDVICEWPQTEMI